VSRAPYRRRADLRLTDEERAEFKRAAAECGQSLSDWLRQLARRASGMPNVADATPCTHNVGEDAKRSD
jgi:hypothetical protein